MAIIKRNNTTLSHRRKLGLSIALSLLIITAVGVWYWNTHKKKFIRNKLEKAISGKSNGLYKIKYDDLKLDEIAGNLSISNMNIVYDITKFDSLKKENSAPLYSFKNKYPPNQLIRTTNTPCIDR
jgi:hypothetical protein